MGAGKYRNRITYKKKEETPGALGEQQVDWKMFRTVWAEIVPIRGREFWDSQQVQSEVTHRITHRYIPGISATMEIHYKSRVFEVLHYHVIDEREKEIEVLAKERLE